VRREGKKLGGGKRYRCKGGLGSRTLPIRWEMGTGNGSNLGNAKVRKKQNPSSRTMKGVCWACGLGDAIWGRGVWSKTGKKARAKKESGRKPGNRPSNSLWRKFLTHIKGNDCSWYQGLNKRAAFLHPKPKRALRSAQHHKKRIESLGGRPRGFCKKISWIGVSNEYIPRSHRGREEGMCIGKGTCHERRERAPPESWDAARTKRTLPAARLWYTGHGTGVGGGNDDSCQMSDALGGFPGDRPRERQKGQLCGPRSVRIDLHARFMTQILTKGKGKGYIAASEDRVKARLKF